MPASCKSSLLISADNGAPEACVSVSRVVADVATYPDGTFQQGADAIMQQAYAYEMECGDTVSDAAHVLFTIAYAQDRATCEHSTRMMPLAEATAARLMCSAGERQSIRLAALLHDIGKIAVPVAIRHKPGSLTAEEWEVMRRHPEVGRHMVEEAGGSLNGVAPLVAAHHERWDGQGYPYRLAQRDIPLGARILAVVDSFDAMTSRRPYRAPISAVAAMMELLRGAGTQYDPLVVRAFLAVLTERVKL